LPLHQQGLLPNHVQTTRATPGSGVVIRTPDRRLRVFVSSALEKLAEERRAVTRAVSALRLTPVMFEQGRKTQTGSPR